MIKKYAESPATATTGGLQPGVTEEQYAGAGRRSDVQRPEGRPSVARSNTPPARSSSRSKKEPRKSPARWAKPKRRSKPQLSTAVPGSDLRPVRRKLPGPVALAHVLRRRLHDRKMLQLQERPAAPAEADPACYEAQPEKPPAGSVPGARLRRPNRHFRARSAIVTPKGEPLAQRPLPARPRSERRRAAQPRGPASRRHQRSPSGITAS